MSRYAKCMLIAAVFSGLSISSCTSTNDSSSATAAASVTATTGFPLLKATLSLEIPESMIGTTSVGAITAGPDGSIVVVDHKSSTIVIFNPKGERLRQFGRKGSGPGEFQRIGPIGWLGDTLVVLEVRLRRTTFVAIPEGSLAGELPWPPSVGRGVSRVMTTSRSLVAEITTWKGPPVPVAFGATTQRRSMHYFPVTAAGFGPEIVALTTPATLPDFREPTCDDGKGSIYFDIGPFRDLGPLGALTSRMELVSAAPESLLITIKSSDLAQGSRQIVPARARVPVSDAVWDSVANEFLALKAKFPAIRCDPPYVKPPFMPGGRMVQIDDADRIWVEVTERAGTSMHVLALDGTPVGVFTMPARDEDIPWFVRNNRLYIVAADSSGLQSVRVYEVGR